MAQKYWGFNVKDIDPGVRPQDDFYRYGNGGWLARTKIPPAESRWGSFVVLRHKTDNQLRAIVKEVLRAKDAAPGSPAQLVRDMYRSAVDLARRNALGDKPLVPLRLMVRQIKDRQTLLEAIAKLHVWGIGSGWSSGVDQDSKNSSRYMLHLWQGGISLPDRDYYLLDKPEQKRVRDAYRAHIRRILGLMKFSPADIEATEAAVMKIETALARASMPKEDLRDPEKTYHKYTLPQLRARAPQIDWALYLAKTHTPAVREVIVGQPGFFAAINSMLTDIPLEEWKRYLDWSVIDDCSALLSQRFVKAHFEFVKVMTGQKKMRPLWRRALGSVGVVGEALGRLYVERHFPPAYKRTVDELVSDLFDVFAQRVRGLDWMSASTKKKALVKLRAMRRKIGYPRTFKSYRGLVIDPHDYFGNMLRAEEWHHRDQVKKLGGPVDRDEWHMFPHTVNAYFSPNLNEIVFPAAILQWPFFDPRADMAVNYAGIGSVIGHEITHGFDDQGAKFDGKGNMRNWWSPQDKKRFEAKGKLLVEQYNRYEVADGVKVNGQLTLGENMADLGGLVIAWDAYQRYLGRHGRRDIAGLSPEQRFFFGFTQIERELSRPELEKLHTLTDPHAPAFTRTNGPLANFEPFYKIFGVKKSDKLYKEPEKRAKIW